MRGKDDYIR